MKTQLSKISSKRRYPGNGISLTVHVLSGILTSFPPDCGIYQILGDSLLESNQPDLARIVYHLGLGSDPESRDLKTRLNQIQPGRGISPQEVSK